MKTYYATPLWKVILVLVPNITIALIITALAYFESFFIIVYAVFGMLWFVMAIYVANKTRIVIDEKGIEYYVPLNFAYRVGWGNINEVGYYWFREGLCVDKTSIEIIYDSRRTYATLMDFGQFSFIPLSIFAKDWKKADIGQHIKQYAPHLFVQDKEIS
jgi:hypothetical protein